MELKIPRQLRRYYFQLIQSRLRRRIKPSEVSLSVLIPLATKDIPSATLAVESIRKHLKHPIDSIIVAGQGDRAIEQFCKVQKLVYINENDVLPDSIDRLDPALLFNSRTGWIKQQIIKLNCFNVIDGQNILAHDADTFFVRDMVFFEGKRQILYSSDEYATAYQNMNRALLGDFRRYARSFIAHGMLFQRDLMDDLHGAIQRHCGQSTVEAILKRVNEPQGMVLSEYELYGNFVHWIQPERCKIRYWYNKNIYGLPPRGLPQLEGLLSRFNSVSNHIRPGHKPKKPWHTTF